MKKLIDNIKDWIDEYRGIYIATLVWTGIFYVLANNANRDSWFLWLLFIYPAVLSGHVFGKKDKMKVDYIGLVLDVIFLLIFTGIAFAGLNKQFGKIKWFIFWAIPLSLVISFIINWLFDPVSYFYSG